MANADSWTAIFSDLVAELETIRFAGSAEFVYNPLIYAAKYGGFEDLDAAGKPLP